MHSVIPGNCFFRKRRSKRSSVPIPTVIFNLHRLCIYTLISVHSQIYCDKEPAATPIDFLYVLNTAMYWRMVSEGQNISVALLLHLGRDGRTKDSSMKLNKNSLIRLQHCAMSSHGWYSSYNRLKKKVCTKRQWVNWGEGCPEEKREGGDKERVGVFWDSRKQFQFSLKTLSIYSQLSEWTPRECGHPVNVDTPWMWTPRECGQLQLVSL